MASQRYCFQAGHYAELMVDKELYEPLWDEILTRSRQQGFGIRNIWIADFSHQGDSGVLNEGLLGNDPGWHDHARDLLHLINVQRDQMPQPIIGIGHSFGGSNLCASPILRSGRS